MTDADTETGTPTAKQAKLDLPPVFSDLDAFALNDAHRARIEGILRTFSEVFGEDTKPTFVCRSPGRVNLIGEHIDYSNYGVLPMAIENDCIIVGCETDDGQLTLASTSPDKFPQSTTPSWPISIDKASGSWINYFLAGYWGVVEHQGGNGAKGLKLLVDGTVPPAAGLSSSSAFVVCSSLVSCIVHKYNIPKAKLAAVCAHSEHYVGTEGGGMDQTISIMAKKGVALNINFNPIRAKEVALPQGYSFVVANSCVDSQKQKTASFFFNKRVAECRAAAILLAQHLGLDQPLAVKRLGALQVLAKKSLPEMAQLAKDVLKDGVYSQQELMQATGITSQEELVAEVLSESTKDQEGFNLRDRAVHVFEEADRVLRFAQTSDPEELGKLMNQSQWSCDKLYDCSCAELNKLTAICRGGGALGSRLTGAGWGGCTVSLVASDRVERFIAHLQKEYYTSKRLASMFDTAVFETTAGPGARVLMLE